MYLAIMMQGLLLKCDPSCKAAWYSARVLTVFSLSLFFTDMFVLLVLFGSINNILLRIVLRLIPRKYHRWHVIIWLHNDKKDWVASDVSVWQRMVVSCSEKGKSVVVNARCNNTIIILLTYFKDII